MIELELDSSLLELDVSLLDSTEQELSGAVELEISSEERDSSGAETSEELSPQAIMNKQITLAASFFFIMNLLQYLNLRIKKI